MPRRLPAISAVLAACGALAQELSQGLTLAWATPIYRRALVPADDPGLDAVAREILAAWRNASDSGGGSATREAGSANDAFFAAQRAEFEDGGRHLLARLPGSAGDASRRWHALWMEAIRDYVASAAGPEGVEALSSQRLALFAWASVHGSCSSHPSHTHVGAAVSGTFYVAVPAVGRANAFFAEDPRGPRPPFENRLVHTPRRGEVLLFPPWMTHGVDASAAWGCEEPREGSARIAISFNLGLPPTSTTSTGHASGESGAAAAAASGGGAEVSCLGECADDPAKLWEVLADVTIAAA